jgi:hypothetical protein
MPSATTSTPLINVKKQIDSGTNSSSSSRRPSSIQPTSTTPLQPFGIPSQVREKVRIRSQCPFLFFQRLFHKCILFYRFNSVWQKAKHRDHYPLPIRLFFHKNIGLPRHFFIIEEYRVLISTEKAY